ncbi:MAG: hypothetical protein QGF57_07415 [Candidatus Marinimicrobia bacterium]|nr:hypothetical protein [Candidatus Neomarinimicrobiota bacterium]
MSNYKFHLLTAGIIALFLGILFNKPLTGEYSFSGVDSMSPAAINQGIESAEEKYGDYPHWLPWVFSGLPSVHSFQNISDFYFLNFIPNFFKWAGIPGFWNYIFHFIIAGMGILCLLIHLGTNRYSALFASLSYVLMPYTITMVVHGHGSQMLTLVWLPWVIFSILRLYREVNFINLAMVAMTTGLQLQRAHVQIAYYTWLSGGLLILFLLIKQYKTDRKKTNWLLPVLGALLLGLAMAMWIYLPALNYTPHSIRGAGSGGGTGLDYATAWSFSFGEMATFFIPSYFGFGGPAYWGNMPFTDYPNYMGILVVLFAVIGLIRHKHSIKYYFALTAFIALLLSFGKHFFLYGVFYDYFPYFNKFRVPVMLLVLTQFSCCVLAGFGLDAVIKNLKEKVNEKGFTIVMGVIASMLLIIFMLNITLDTSSFGRKSHPVLNPLRFDMVTGDTITGVIILFIAGGLLYVFKLGKLNGLLFTLGITLLSVFDLSIVNNKIIEPSPESYRLSSMSKRSLISPYLREDEVIRFLKQDKDKFRILPVGVLGNENRFSAFHIESVSGYHPAKLFRYNELKDKVGWSSMGVLQMLNVKYLVSLEPVNHPYFEEIYQGKYFHRGKYELAKVYRFLLTSPRIFIPQRVQPNTDVQDQKIAMGKPVFNPDSLVFTEDYIKKYEYNPNSKVKITSWSPDRIEIQVDFPKNQFLVLSEIFYDAGWKITSHPDMKIIPVNTILRGLSVPAGEHTITMEFLPDDIRLGAILTWSSFLITLVILILGIRKKLELK